MKFISQVTIVAFVSLFFSIQAFGTEAGECKAFAGTRHEDPARKVRALALKAIAPYQSYFDAIGSRLHERQFIIELAELALLAEEHLLLMGPPGTAKSLVADTILGNILERSSDKNSYFRIQMTPETTISETHGPLDFKKLQETGAYVRILEESAFLSKTNFIDEIFDARANGLRNLLGLLNERAHAQGTHITKGLLETAIAATNLYLSQVYEKAGDDKPKAAIDRFAFSAFVPGEFADTSSYISLIQGAGLGQKPLPKFYFDELDSLRELVKQVQVSESVAKFLSILTTRMKAETEATEQSSIANYKKRLKDGDEPGIPYRATKYFNPRTAASKAGGVLKAIVVRDWIHKKGKRKLEVTIEDISELRKFFVLNGPNETFVNQLLERATNADERMQLQTIQIESQIFDRHYNELLNETNSVLVHYSLHDLQLEVEMAPSSERQELSQKIISFILALDDEADPNTPHAERTGKDIGVGLVREQYVELLAQTLGGRAEANKVMSSLDQERKALVARRQAEEERERQQTERERMEEERRVAAENAAREAREAQEKAENEAFIASYASKNVVWKRSLNIPSFSYRRTGYNKTLGLIAFLEPSSGALMMIDVGARSNHQYASTVHLLELDARFKTGGFSEVHILDKNTIVLIDDFGKAAHTIDLTTNDVVEVPLQTGEHVMKSAFDVDTRELIVISHDRTFSTGKLGEGRKKGKISFDSSELETEWNSVMDDGMHHPQASRDGKYLTLLEQYGSKAFVIERDRMKVVASQQLSSSRVSLVPNPVGRKGDLFYSSGSLLFADKHQSPVKYEVGTTLSTAQVQLMSNYGLALLPGSKMAILGGLGSPALHSLVLSTEPTQASTTISESYAPILLDDGRVVTAFKDAATGQWNIGILD